MGFISNFVSSIGGFISSITSTIGPIISNFADKAINIMNKIPGIKLEKVISIASKIVHSVLEFLGIKSEEKPEILGAKAEQSDKSIEDFDNDVEAYIKYLKEEIEFDKEKFDKMTEEEKIGCKAIGMALETKAVEQKIGGVEISPECLATLTKIQSAGISINAKELVSVIQVLKDSGITNMNDVVEYLEGKGDSDRIRTGEVLVAALGAGAADKISELKDAVRQYEED